MDCPRCGGQLVVHIADADGVRQENGPYRSTVVVSRERVRELDRCLVCRGIWFDVGEMKQGLRQVAAELPERTNLQRLIDTRRALSQDVRETVVRCPRCATSMNHKTSLGAPSVVFDQCPRCRGVWFDGGELSQFADPEAAALALASGEFES
jgi:Zn-finger nucleic acid-binding protein